MEKVEIILQRKLKSQTINVKENHKPNPTFV